MATNMLRNVVINGVIWLITAYISTVGGVDISKSPLI